MASTLVLAGCGGPVSTLDPAGPAADAIARLWWVMLIGAVALFILMMALFGLVMLRPGAGSGLSRRGWILAGGLGMPLPILTALLVYALIQGERLLPHPDGGPNGGVVRVEAVARQFAWEFHYPELGAGAAGTTLNVLHIPAGRAVDVTTRSDDVIHSFWVPRLGGKIDATPGHSPTIRLRADRPGLYAGLCAEYCGTGHRDMGFTVEAHPPALYEQRLRAALAGEEAQ